MSEKMRWRDMISAYGFAIFDLYLYLDTNPRDVKAIQLRDAYLMKQKKLINAYEQKFGPFIMTKDDVRGDCWTWVNNPWPWDYVRGE